MKTPLALPAGWRTLVVIPARLDSTRLPRKPLLVVAGKPLIQHVYEGVMKAQRQLPALIHRVMVATESQEIYDRVRTFGGTAVLTAATHRNGSERIFEVVERHPEFELLVNVQGDEPLVAASTLKNLLSPFAKATAKASAEEVAAVTLKKRISAAAAENPNTVKVVCDREGRALYFSRAKIPYLQQGSEESAASPYFQHLGLYAYRRAFLSWYVKTAPTFLEQCERLEQLRILEAGRTLQVVETEQELLDVNTAADLARFERFLARRS